MSEEHFDLDECLGEGPQSALERQLVKEYLHSKGYRKQDLLEMPKEQVKQLMTEACRYASLKLAEMEAKSQFREDIRAPSQKR